MRLITPPLPAESRPSKMTTTLSFLCCDPVLQLDQLALQPEQFLEIDVTVDRGEPAIGGSCRPELIEFAVVELEFELLIEAIPKIGADELVQGLVIAGIHLRSSVWVDRDYDSLMTFDSGVTVPGRRPSHSHRHQEPPLQRLYCRSLGFERERSNSTWWCGTPHRAPDFLR